MNSVKTAEIEHWLTKYKKFNEENFNLICNFLNDNGVAVRFKGLFMGHDVTVTPDEKEGEG